MREGFERSGIVSVRSEKIRFKKRKRRSKATALCTKLKERDF